MTIWSNCGVVLGATTALVYEFGWTNYYLTCPLHERHRNHLSNSTSLKKDWYLHRNIQGKDKKTLSFDILGGREPIKCFKVELFKASLPSVQFIWHSKRPLAPTLLASNVWSLPTCIVLVKHNLTISRLVGLHESFIFIISCFGNRQPFERGEWCRTCVTYICILNTRLCTEVFTFSYW